MVQTECRVYRVLLVDDVPAVCEALRWLLEEMPQLAVVGEAADGVEAVARARELEPDLVILDIELPKLDGYRVAGMLKALPRPPVVIFLSVHDDAASVQRGLAAGGDAFVQKGSGWPGLAEQLRRVLG